MLIFVSKVQTISGGHINSQRRICSAVSFLLVYLEYPSKPTVMALDKFYTRLKTDDVLGQIILRGTGKPPNNYVKVC